MKNITKRLFSGIRQRHVNEVVWNIYGYKFYGNDKCLVRLIAMAKEDLRDVDFDIVVPIQPRDSGSDIVARVAHGIAGHADAEVCNVLSSTNSSIAYKADLRGKTLLLVDDVIYTGKTARKAEKALLKLKPAKILFYALAKSKNNKM